MRQDCATTKRELWACWPQAPSGHAARQAMIHAEQCPECRSEIAALRSLDGASTSLSGRPLGWTEVLPRRRWLSLAAKTRRALSAPQARPAAAFRIPALAAAGAAVLALYLAFPRPATRVPPPAPAPAPRPAPAAAAPIKSADELEMLDHLDLLENWDGGGSIPASARSAP